MKISRWIAVLGIAPIAPTWAAPVCTDLSLPVCAQSQLEEEDRALNALYSRLMSKASGTDADRLRVEQRQWLRERNTACGLVAGATNSPDWIAKVAADPRQALCVYGSTHARVELLQGRTALNTQLPSDTIDRHEITFPVSHDSGKWYAEVTFFGKGYGDDDNQPIQVAVTNGKAYFGAQIPRREMRADAQENGNYVVGLAVDVDSGRLYWSANGAWRGAKPGAVEGMPVPAGERYALRVVSTGPSISESLSIGYISINAGQMPFQYATPAGFRPFYTVSANVAGGSKIDWIVPIYKKVAGASLPDWATRYWAWLLPKAPERSATEDTTGEFCADGQSGPVWYLAGADAKSHITRNCHIARGKYLLLPALAQMVYRTKGEGECARYERERIAEQASFSVRATYIVLDGERFDGLDDFRPFTPKCTSIRGTLGEVVVDDAIFFGSWVMLQPLPPGEHVISFGGELPATNTYRAVTYRLTVD